MARRANGAMTWNHDRDWIRAVGGADGANCARTSYSSRDFGIRARFAGWDRAQLLPHGKLKWSAANIHRRRRHGRAAGDIVRERNGPITDARVLGSIRVNEPKRRPRVVG